ncbi:MULTISPECIES: class I SAM-dependent methyltransferase [Burkholderiaceae]|uniref:class I SAM-dependent methyltransferase n=1 Tax=Burkholderiaceae TaxID=119060 RepID=UPI00095F27F7|nr:MULTISPECIES: class I SAM-dependent methyltransferase [Burkholderiaceae]MCF2133226.1 class I SAM-dependent methyltransferase [Mycetohabitans sp. B3]MCG1017856.1 class I SAM-dependent methyltransferase [Mycetohabitans sp. B4]MCG1038679.1 class I SAM-dependent methyltransferase [Mycetohabitans sp. B7]SIT67690.1 Methyltransferase domain-containing protein [Burkholderia sp. b13]SIT81757.1 Methyltransferase domain-containing protein [Burkholderia sp. b14]
MSNRPIIDWPTWTESPPGRYVLAWEQSQLDRLVSDMFGYYALQLGLPQLDALRENRMPCRGLVLDAASGASAPYRLPDQNSHGAADTGQRHAPPQRETLWCDFLDLPFESQSVDLLILPHTLEFTRDPHRLLREAERVLVPEGRLVIVGFNSLSLWGMRQSISRRGGRAFVPAAHDLIAFTRMKDWIKLLGFELDRGRFGCYRPPVNTETWLARYAFMEAAGDRWWPIFGATYMITAIKRVHGMRLIGPAKVKKQALAPALNPVAAPNAP